MGYNDMEDGLETMINLNANYSSTNVSKGDYRIFDNASDRILLIEPGGAPIREVSQSPRRMRTVWTIYLDLYIPFVDEISNIAANIRSFPEDLIDHIDKYPTLNGTANCIHALITSISDPTYWTGGEQNYWMQRMTMQVEERETITIAE